MTNKQRELLFQLGNIYAQLNEECMHDDSFHDTITKNNDLFTLSLDELSAEWFAIAEGERE